jgi:ABC-2 type transport system permease protein
MSTRPLYWSIRRELWENRSLYLAPLIIASVALLAFSIHSYRLTRTIAGLSALTPAKQELVVFKPYSMAASMILFFSFVVGAFYCLDALHGERRDRSILFWKSLPVSDRTTVLSKALIPVAVLPLLAFTVALATQLGMLLLSTLALAVRGVSPLELWRRLPLPSTAVVMFYGVAAHALWWSPLYAWILLVSAWAKRAVLLWVVLPCVAVIAIEKMLGGSWFSSLIGYRFNGALKEGFTPDMMTPTALNFVTTPGLYAGMLFAAACVAAAIRLRRNREPI